MAGEAKTTDFLLGTATVMFGPPAEVFDLTPADHGVGLTKSVSVTAAPAFTDLTQGVRNQNVYSIMTGNVVTMAAEIYEYTASNVIYATGLDGSSHMAPTATSTLASAVIADDSTITVETGDGGSFSAGDWVVIEDGAMDKIFVRKVASISVDTLTLEAPALPSAIPAGSAVRAKSLIEVGSKEEQPFLGCKIVGSLANDKPVALIFPKIRITNGFNIGFMTDDYQNMPFEMTAYDLVSSDPQFARFNGAQGMAFL